MSVNNAQNFAFFSENKGLIDLKSKSNAELKELLDRQNNILNNKLLVSKLKDSGEKVRKIRNEIFQELESRLAKEKQATRSLDNSAIEWREVKTNVEENKAIDIEDNVNALKIISENGQIPDTNKSHATKLIEKEKDPNFSFKPYAPAVAEKIKKVVPDAHTLITSPTLVKTVHLNESLNLLSQQMSALKILGSRSKRVEECIEDRINESIEIEEQEAEETDELETKITGGINVNVTNS